MKKSIVYLSLAVLFVSTLQTSVFVSAGETQAGEIKAPEEVSLGRERTVTANQKKCFAVKGEPDTKRVTVNRGDEMIKIVELNKGRLTQICTTYTEGGNYKVSLPNPEGIETLYLPEGITHFQKGNAKSLQEGNRREEITNYGELSESTEVSKEEALPTENFPYEGGTEGGSEEETNENPQDTLPTEEETTPPTEEEPFPVGEEPLPVEEVTPPTEEEATPPTEEEPLPIEGEAIETFDVTATPEGCFTRTELAGNITITDYAVERGEQCTKEVIIPASIEGKPVTSIGARAFSSNQLTSITIPDSVTSIGEDAFAYNQLTSVTLGTGVTSIGYMVFYGNDLTSITIPDSVTSIGAYAFSSNPQTGPQKKVKGYRAAGTAGMDTIPANANIIVKNATLTIFLSGSVVDKPEDPTKVLLQGQTESGVLLTGTLIDGTVQNVPVGADGSFSMELAKTEVTDTIRLVADSEEKWRSDTLILTIPALAKDPNNQEMPAACFMTSISNEEITITSYGMGVYPECNSTEIVIPGVIAGNPVISIGQYAFAGRQLTSVILPNSVTSIGNGAFVSNQLTSVTLGTGVTSIGEDAFNSNKLTSVTIPNSVTSIGPRAFSNNQLISATIPNGSIGYMAFSSNQLTSVTLGTGVSSIGQQAFASNKLTSLTIPSGSIGEQALWDNQLSSLILGAGVTSIGARAFSNNQLTSLTIPSGSIGEGAFSSNKLTSVTLGTGVTSIGEQAFLNNQLISATILNGSIGRVAFYGNQLTSVTLGTGVASIGQEAFKHNQLRSVTIPDSVTSIGEYAFADNPQVVKGYRAAGTGGITVAANANILVRDWTLTLMTSLSGEVVDKEGDPTKVIIQGQTESGAQLTGTLLDGTSYTIPVNAEGNFSFELAKTELTDKIALVADSGIVGKRGSDPLILTIPSLAKDPDNREIPVACFATNLSAGKITITDYKREIYPECIAEVIIPEFIAGNPVTSIGNRAFSSNQLTSVVLPDSVISIGSAAFLSNKLISIIIPNSVTWIGDYAFYNNQLTSVTIPNSVTSIRNDAFARNQLVSLTIPNSVIDIGGAAFQSNQLSSVMLPDSVTSIGNNAFGGNKLTSVIIPNSVTNIGFGAFYGNQLISLTIPNGSIGEQAFAYNQLTAVTLGTGVTNIGARAFVGNPQRVIGNPQRVKGYRENGQVGIVIDTSANIVVRNWTVTTPLTGQVVDKPQDPVIAIIQGETESGAQLTGTLVDGTIYSIPVDEEGKFILELEKKEAPQGITLIANSGGEKWRSDPLTLTVPALESTSDPEESESKKRSGGGATIIKKNPCSGDNCEGGPSKENKSSDGESILKKTDEEKIYTRAFEKGLTTMPSLEEARMGHSTTRAELAKIITLYATKFHNKTPDTTKTQCTEYKDLNTTNAELAEYVVQSCELGLMGYWSNGVVTKEYFLPNGVVTRAEVATILSRLLRGNTYLGSNEENWYQGHLSALKSEQIIQTDVAPSTLELRGNIYIMLKRVENR